MGNDACQTRPDVCCHFSICALLRGYFVLNAVGQAGEIYLDGCGEGGGGRGGQKNKKH